MNEPERHPTNNYSRLAVYFGSVPCLLWLLSFKKTRSHIPRNCSCLMPRSWFFIWLWDISILEWAFSLYIEMQMSNRFTDVRCFETKKLFLWNTKRETKKSKIDSQTDNWFIAAPKIKDRADIFFQLCCLAHSLKRRQSWRQFYFNVNGVFVHCCRESQRKKVH